MTCLRCNDTGYLRDRSRCSCAARPFDGAEPGSRPWSDAELAFLLRLREQSTPGSNAIPEDHSEPPAADVELDEPAEPVSKADALMERARRMGRAS